VELEDPEGKDLVDAAIGNGPVDAIFKAVNRIVGVSTGLADFEVRAVTGGSDAVGEVTVRITEELEAHAVHTSNGNGLSNGNGNGTAEDAEVVTYHGHGADSDILTASAKAYLSAINKMLSLRTSQDTVGHKSKKRRTEGV